MIERLPNAPIAILFRIIGMGYLLGKQKMCGFKPRVSLRCAAHGRRSQARLQAAQHPSIVKEEARSPMPSFGYTGAYAFANVLLTVAGSVILLL